jgi:hypothetical protein
LPKELHFILQKNKKVGYEVLFKASSMALMKAAGNIDFLGAQTGALAILHTWSQTLNFHPHIHMLVPAGGISDDGMEWINPKKKFFLPWRVLSRIYRGIFTRLIEEALEKSLIKITDNNFSFSGLKDRLYRKDWNVYLKKSFGGADSVLKYLARYTHRVAINNSRLISGPAQKVSFWYKDNKANGKKKIMEVETNEFIRRFLQHILPANFYKIRYYGILAIVNSSTKKAQCLALLDKDVFLPIMEGLRGMELVELIKKTDPLLCPACKTGKLTYKIRDAG